VTKIALLGTGGKMGLRLSTNLKDTRFDVDHVEVSAEGRASLKTVLGIECMEQGQAISSADALSRRCQTGGSGRSSRRSSRSPSGRQGRCA
jgi:3-hydroxyisobutyrate dehydrogenase-like beta-hydroxyacid dehydrogenase